MSLIMYFTRAPRYENITMKDIKLIDSYFRWQHEKEIGSRYGNGTFENWCGHSENELPSMEVISYYKPFFTKKSMYIEGIGKQEGNSIFEQLARFAKANHIYNWFIKNVANGKVDREYYEVTKEQCEDFLRTCNEVKNKFVFVGKNKYTNSDEYSVNEEIAKELLPVMDNVGYFFGPNTYNEFYVECIIKAIEVVENILKT